MYGAVPDCSAYEKVVNGEKTVIIDLRDNGTEPSANQNVYRTSTGSLGQGGVHVPLIISGPGIPTGDVDAMLHVTDPYSTILELRGLPPLEGDEHGSISMLPDLLGPEQPPQRELMLTELLGAEVPASLAGWSARAADDTLARLFTVSEELYNLREDPIEEVDLMLKPLTESQQAAAYLLGDCLEEIEAQAGF